jgi:hypothetical protein
MSVLPEDYFTVGSKVSFLHARDAKIWGVNDTTGIIKSSRSFNSKEKMLIIHFDNIVVTASTSRFRIANDE